MLPSTKLKRQKSSIVKIKSLESIYLVTILKDCVNQFAILGHIMPDTFEGTSQEKQIVDNVLKEAVERQHDMEDKYKAALAQKQKSKAEKFSYRPSQADNNKFHEVAKELGRSTLQFARTVEQNPLTSDNIIKINEDRQYVQDIMESVVSDLRKNRSFTSLISAVAKAKKTKRGLHETIEKEQSSHQRLKELMKLVAEVTEEKEREIQNRNEMIAYLKDQIQEMKAKTGMESKYVNKCSKLSVTQTQKICHMAEQHIRKDIDNVEIHLDLETRVNAEIVQYLGKLQMRLDEKLEFWMEKHEKDVEDKQKQLDDLKTLKNTDWKRLVDLTRKYKEYEEVVVEDRIQKEILRRKMEEENLYIKASIRVQAWWRGIMVRKGYGTFRKKKKKTKNTKKSKGTK
ncbi:dynein regulatory complex protein 9 [Octopus bimaculoides]|nr:dynein regulatory complex protein 9 [Octopus bimaculoides]|eukprot:XP_014779582.1 PREDICTED: IQ domain-containing protein G-like [Octopus bimaculoides]